MLLGGIVFGLQKTGPLCGSPLVPDSRAAEAFDALHRGAGAAASCYRSIGAAAVPTWVLVALGVVLVLAGVTVRIVAISRSVAMIQKSGMVQQSGMVQKSGTETDGSTP